MRGVWLLTAVLAAAWGMGAAAHAGEAMLNHSDVVSFGPASPDVYREFWITVVEWGGHPESEEGVEAWAEHQVRPAHELGIRYAGGVGMVTEFASFMRQYPEWEKALCRNVRGEPFTVPWLWDHSWEGKPAYWFCTHDPMFQDFLRKQVVMAARAGVDGIHVDDHLGSAAPAWLDGCFCEDCVAGFRDYLREHVSRERLTELGISDLDTFDYRQYVVSWLDAHPGRWTFSAPLGAEYRTYQYRYATKVMADLREAAERAAGHALTFSANGAPPSPTSIVDYQVLTSFSAEVSHEARLDDGPAHAYKVAAALGRPLTATGGGRDWAAVKAGNRSGLVRAWIAQAYAFGQFFMTPHHQWCYTEELGTHWYRGPAEDYGPIYRFIREHRGLFDGQESVGQVAVLYNARAWRDGEGPDREISRALLEGNVPFDMVVAGDDWVPAKLTREAVARYAKVIAPAGTTLEGEQQAVLDALRGEGRLVEWRGGETLSQLPRSWVRVTGAENVWAVVRAREDGKSAVVHLLPREYNAETDRVSPAGPVTVSIDAAAFGGRVFRKATLYAVGSEPVTLEVAVEGGRMTFTAPGVSEWGIVELTGGV